jgi:hypothetical protein
MAPNALIFTPDRNVHENDYAGAFYPESRAFAKLHGIATSRIRSIDVSRPLSERHFALCGEIAKVADLELLAFFCHGWPLGIQVGAVVGRIRSFAATIVAASKPGIRVVLYACSTGADPARPVPPRDGAPGGDGGFADQLRDALCIAGRADCQVDAHTVRGHATQNPFVRRFSGDGSPIGGQGGGWIVAPHSLTQWAAWRHALEKTDLRFRFPLLSLGEIHHELAPAPKVVA